MDDKIPKEAMKAAAAVSRETGEPLDKLLHEYAQKKAEVAEKRQSNNGKFRVLGVDRYSDEDWIVGEYDTAEEALRVARDGTKEAMPDASDASVATVYHAYTPDGRYLGGDVWEGE